MQLLLLGAGKPCLRIRQYSNNYQNKEFKVNEEFKEGEILTIDGSCGEVMSGEVKTIKPDISGIFQKL